MPILTSRVVGSGPPRTALAGHLQHAAHPLARGPEERERALAVARRLELELGVLLERGPKGGPRVVELAEHLAADGELEVDP